MYKVSACFLTGACVEKKQHLENGYLKRKLLTQTFWTIFFSTQGPSLGFFLVFAVSMYRLCTNSTQGGVNKFKLVKSKDWFLYFFSDCRKMIWTNLLTVSLISDCLTTDLKYLPELRNTLKWWCRRTPVKVTILKIEILWCFLTYFLSVGTKTLIINMLFTLYLFIWLYSNKWL